MTYAGRWFRSYVNSLQADGVILIFSKLKNAITFSSAVVIIGFNIFQIGTIFPPESKRPVQKVSLLQRRKVKRQDVKEKVIAEFDS